MKDFTATFFQKNTLLQVLLRYSVFDANLKRSYASENGTELNSILSKMSPLNPQYLKRKQRVFQKIAAFVEKFKGVGGEI